MRSMVVPIGVTAVLGLGLPYLAAAAAMLAIRAVGIAQTGTLTWLYVHHAFQLLLALAAIVLIKRWRPFDAGLRWPPGRAYFGPALAWGALFGVIMTLVDYAPDLVARRAPDIGFPLTAANVTGWIIFEGAYVGPTEEIPFRSLLVGYLMSAMPGELRAGRYTIRWAGIVVAAIFALAHAAQLVAHPSWRGAGQQIYAFALGVLYAYWFEKSRSVAAPILGHNASDLVEYLIVFALIVAWR